MYYSANYTHQQLCTNTMRIIKFKKKFEYKHNNLHFTVIKLILINEVQFDFIVMNNLDFFKTSILMYS